MTFSQVTQAVNFLACTLYSVFGLTLNYDFEILTSIGVPDLRYNIIFYAAANCVYKVWLFDVSNICATVLPNLKSPKVLLSSPRNFTTTNLSQLKQTKFTELHYTSELEGIVQTLVASMQDMRALQSNPLIVFLKSMGLLSHSIQALTRHFDSPL